MRFGRRQEPPVDDVPIREDTIRLGQFLKLANLVDSGADAKAAIAAGEVLVDGDVETRRGRQLGPGDVVELAGRRARVAQGEPEIGPEIDVPW